MNPVKRRLVLAGTHLAFDRCRGVRQRQQVQQHHRCPDDLPRSHHDRRRDADDRGRRLAHHGAAAPTTAAGSTVDFSKLSGSLVASGATFPKGFYDDAIADARRDRPRSHGRVRRRRVRQGPQ